MVKNYYDVPKKKTTPTTKLINSNIYIFITIQKKNSLKIDAQEILTLDNTQRMTQKITILVIEKNWKLTITIPFKRDNTH